MDAEGPHLADPDWMGMLAGLGIVKGQPFAPDERTRGILDRVAKSAYQMSRVLAFDEVVSGRSFRMYPDRRWVNPMADATSENPSGKLDLSWRRVDRGGALDVGRPCRAARATRCPPAPWSGPGSPGSAVSPQPR